MKKTIGLLILLMVGLSFVNTSCSCSREKSADDELAEQTDKIMEEMNRELGMPNLQNYQEKKFLKWIYELCDQEDLICHAYIFVPMTGKFVYLGECIGYGIPYSAQYSAPYKYDGVTTDKVEPGARMRDWVWSYEMVPQAEPNGLYKPEGLSATWLIMIDPTTKEISPVYMEPEIMVTPFRMKNLEE